MCSLSVDGAMGNGASGPSEHPGRKELQLPHQSCSKYSDHEQHQDHEPGRVLQVERGAISNREGDLHLIVGKPYPDHHLYDPDDIMKLVELATETGAHLVTTEKDRVRLPMAAREMVEVVRVFVEYADPDALSRILEPL